MAEEKLGTLQYEMIVSEQKLKESLTKIDGILKAKDAEWKSLLSGSGAVMGALDTTKIIASVKEVTNVEQAENAKRLSSWQWFLKENMSGYMKLEGSHKAAVDRMSAEWKKLDAVQKASYANGARMPKVLRQSIDARKLSIQQSKEELSAKQALESQRSKAFVKSNLDDEKRITDEIKKQESALRSLEAQRSKAFVRGEVEKEKQITREIKEQQSAIRSLEAQRSRAYVATQTKALREEQLALKASWQEQKLKMAVDNQAAGSIERLRAQYALLKFQLSQVKFSDPNAVANVQKLQSAISGVKSEIQALQPTLGIWGKLTSAIRTYATAYLSVQAVLGLGRAVYGQTKELDSLNFSMKTVIKSSTELAQTQKFLSEVAVNYGGDLLTLSERYIKFRAAAIQSNMSAGETQKIFESVSKAAGTLGLKTDELSGVYLALEQMISKGKVTTEELRRQLGERLPGAFGIMANALGVTIPELDKLLKKGEILSSVALPKFAAALEKAYGIESLTKIDTLAAAQGRLSTEFTGLIKSLQASDTFKNTLNNIAGVIGFFKDYMGAITLTTKALISLALANGIWKTSIILSIPIQKAMLIMTKEQTRLLPLLSAEQLAAATTATAAAAGTTKWSRAMIALNTAWKENPLGIALTVITLIGSAFYLFSGKTKEAQRTVSTFADSLSAEKSKLDQLFTSINRAGKGTYEYKDALFQINNLYGKYLPNLLTEKSSIDEVAKARNLANKSLEEEMMLRERNSRLEVASADKDKVMAEIMNDILAASPSTSAVKKGQIFARVMDIANIGELDPDKRKALITKAFKGDLDAIEAYVSKATYALEGYKAKVASIDAFFTARADKKVELFKPESIDAAKKDFEEYAKLQSQGAGQLMISPFIDKDNQTLKQWLSNQIKLYKGNEDALRSLYLAQADLDKSQSGQEAKSLKLKSDRAEAIKKLNDKYLVDQEDFANYEMGIQSTRIANMEDGLDKEKKLNDLAYERRIAAIEKEKIATLKLLNEAAGIRVGSKEEIKTLDATGYSKDVQDQVAKAREADLTKRKNAENDLRESNLKSEKDYQIKINEIRRDANDQFLSGLEKERAAINEKYDEWVRKAGTNMKLIAEIEHSRNTALSEIYIQYEIDQLDFTREIEMKKNEIRLSGSASQRKLDKANFDTYEKYERQRIKLLKSSELKDKQREGLNKEQELAADKKLFAIKQEKELESKILDGAQKISEEYIKQAGLTGESAESLTLAVNTLQSIAKQDYFSAALGVLGKIFTSFSNENENEVLKYFEQLKIKISAVVEKISTLNSVLAKLGSSSSVMGVKLLQSEMFNLANDAARLNEQLKTMAVSDGGGRRGSTTQGASANGGRSDATEIESSRRRIVIDLIKQTEYLNQQIIMLSNKLLDPNLTEDQRKAIESVLNGYIEIVDAIDASIQSITGTSINELSNAIVDAFLAGENAAEAWGNKVTDIIRYMVKQQLVAQLLTKPITQAIQTLVADSEDTLTPEEALKFKNTIKGITEDVSPAIAAAAAALKQVGIDLSTTTTSSGISKGIQALTEDTGRRLEGLINSIRESSVINVGNTKQLVESSQMIQGYAAQSLGHLRNIDATTAAQLTLFNEIMTSASGTGGKGIKVYVQ